MAIARTHSPAYSKYNLDLEDIKAPDEYHYPECNRLNTFWIWGFIIVYAAFNIGYWKVAIDSQHAVHQTVNLAINESIYQFVDDNTFLNESTFLNDSIFLTDNNDSN